MLHIVNNSLQVLATEVNVGQVANDTNDLTVLPLEVYYHVRYATAERFGDPVVADYSEPPADGKKERVECPQVDFRLGNFFGEGEKLKQSEDCQFLTIFTPSRQGKYPVMVWIHGGSYVSGCGEDKAYDASNLAREGQMVVVTMNYRHGVFGYLNNIEGGEYNMGVKDQIAALRWVNKHISHFGGDPQRITLAGESAGAHAVATVVANTNETLFQKVIVQSAPYNVEAKDSEAQNVYNYIHGKLGKDPKEATVEELLEAQSAYMAEVQEPVMFGPYQSRIYTAPPNPALRKALITWTLDDCSIFVAHKFKRMDKFGSLFDRIGSRLATFWVFKNPAKKYVKHLEKYGVECETFEVDWRPNGSPFGAAHGLDIILLFSSWDRWKDAGIVGNATKEEWEQQGFALRAKWIEFVHSN